MHTRRAVKKFGGAKGQQSLGAPMRECCWFERAVGRRPVSLWDDDWIEFVNYPPVTGHPWLICYVLAHLCTNGRRCGCPSSCNLVD